MSTLTKILLPALAGAVAALSSAQFGLADGFETRPITIEARGGGLASITISNPSDRKIYLENSVQEWRQDDLGRDVLTDSTAAVVSPPAMWIQPGSTYTLRIQLPPATDRELAFRVILQQIPDRSQIQAGRILFAVTQSLPAFSEPPELSPGVLHARFLDPTHLLITNDGGRRARLADIKANGQIVAPGLAGYALAHSTVSVTLRSPVRPGMIEVETDKGHQTLDLR